MFLKILLVDVYVPNKTRIDPNINSIFIISPFNSASTRLKGSTSNSSTACVV